MNLVMSHVCTCTASALSSQYRAAHTEDKISVQNDDTVTAQPLKNLFQLSLEVHLALHGVTADKQTRWR